MGGIETAGQAGCCSGTGARPQISEMALRWRSPGRGLGLRAAPECLPASPHPAPPCTAPMPAQTQRAGPLTVGPHRHVDGDVHVAGALVLVADAQPKVPLGLADGEGACAWRVSVCVGVGWGWGPTSGPPCLQVQRSERRAPGMQEGQSRGKAGSGQLPAGARAGATNPQPCALPTAPVPVVLLAQRGGPHHQLPRQLRVVPVHSRPAAACGGSVQGQARLRRRTSDSLHYLCAQRASAGMLGAWLSGEGPQLAALPCPAPRRPARGQLLACCRAAGRAQSARHRPRSRRRPTSRTRGLVCGTASSAWAALSGSQSCT